MYYETSKNDHGLPHNPFKAIIAPRPIGWISTVDKDGRHNLAPYSFFNAVCDTPPMVMFSTNGYKDTIANLEATGEFVCNMVSYDLVNEMNVSSGALPHGTSEFEAAGLETADCQLVNVPCCKAYSALECKVASVQRVTDIDGNETPNWIIVGQVVAVHIADEAITEGRFDLTKVRPVSRLGYKDYAVTDELFELERPKG